MKDPVVVIICHCRHSRRGLPQGVDRPHRPYQPRKSEHSAGEVAVESTTRQLASHEVAVTRRTATQTVGAKTWPTSFP